MINCPKCFSEMEITSFKEIEVDRCTNCKGLWFQPEELAALRTDTWMADYILDEGEAKVGKQYNRMRDIKCPQCERAMEPESDADQAHVVYESCPLGHGVFLDAGEFTDLMHKTFWDKFKRAR